MAVGTRLRAIERTDADRGKLYAALDIYRQEVRPEEQNPEPQILHWIDHRHDIAADEFRCFAIEHNNQVIGYLQYSFFSEENLFFLEYLCIRRPPKSGLLLDKGTLNSLREHFAQNYKPGFAVVFEVAHEHLSSGKRVSDRRRLNYFERFGFRRVDYPYRYPGLRAGEAEVSFPADLMVMLPEDRKMVSSAELRTMLRSIYFKHYLRWDKPFLNPLQYDDRQKLIEELYAVQLTQMGNSSSFPTEGNDKRPGFFSFSRFQPSLKSLFAKLFGPKLPRLLAIIILFVILARVFDSVWLLIPFVLAVAILYCLAEDTETSAKILTVVLSRITVGPPRQ